MAILEAFDRKGYKPSHGRGFGRRESAGLRDFLEHAIGAGATLAGETGHIETDTAVDDIACFNSSLRYRPCPEACRGSG